MDKKQLAKEKSYLKCAPTSDFIYLQFHYTTI